MSSTNTGAVVLHGVVSQSELTQVVTNHLSLDFNVAEVVTVVHTDNATDHLGNNDHVTEVGLHGLRALVLTSSSLLKHQKQIQLQIEQRRTYSLLKSLQESHRLSLQTTAETTAGTSLQTRKYIARKNQTRVNTTTRSITKRETLPHFTYSNQLHQILRREIQKLVQINSTVSELLESSLLLLLSSKGGGVALWTG